MVEPFAIHHVDVHVSNLTRTRTLFDPVMAELGLGEVRAGETSVTYYPAHRRHPFVGFTAGEQMPRGGTLRAAFAASDRAAVDRIGALLTQLDARCVEGPQVWDEYADDYYAVFFEDTDGNRFEVVHRAAAG